MPNRINYMIKEDIITVVCQNKLDADEVKAAYEASNPGAALDIIVRSVSSEKTSPPVSSGAKPVIFSVQVSDAVASAWVVTIQKR